MNRWLEQRRKKKRENENIEFSKTVIKNWMYKRDGALAKKVCYEGMLPYTRIMVCGLSSNSSSNSSSTHE